MCECGGRVLVSCVELLLGNGWKLKVPFFVVDCSSDEEKVEWIEVSGK